MESPLLADKVLQRAHTLPVKPAPVQLKGAYVHMEPLDLRLHVEPLYRMASGASVTLGNRSHPAYDADRLIWQYMSAGPFSNQHEFTAYLANLVTANDTLPFCVCDSESGHPIGCAALMSNVPHHLRIEIGSIWYSPIAQRSFANTEAAYLLLSHAFALGYRRLEWKCDALNSRSRRAALRIGFTFEGIQESHMIIKGRNRDTAWFRILKDEWAPVKVRLEQRLYEKESNE